MIPKSFADCVTRDVPLVSVGISVCKNSSRKRNIMELSAQVTRLADFGHLARLKPLDVTYL